MALLSALEKFGRPVVAVDVPELGCVLHLREMSVGDRLALSAKFSGEAGAQSSAFDWYMALIAATVCDDETGAPVADVEKLRASLLGMGQSVFNAITREVERINRMGGDAVASAEKNSETTTNSTSASSSPTD